MRNMCSMLIDVGSNKHIDISRGVLPLYIYVLLDEKCVQFVVLHAPLLWWKFVFTSSFYGSGIKFGNKLEDSYSGMIIMHSVKLFPLCHFIPLNGI